MHLAADPELAARVAALTLIRDPQWLATPELWSIVPRGCVDIVEVVALVIVEGIRHYAMRLFVETGHHCPVIGEGFRLKLVRHPFGFDTGTREIVEIVKRQISRQIVPAEAVQRDEKQFGGVVTRDAAFGQGNY